MRALVWLLGLGWQLLPHGAPPSGSARAGRHLTLFVGVTGNPDLGGAATAHVGRPSFILHANHLPNLPRPAGVRPLIAAVGVLVLGEAPDAARNGDIGFPLSAGNVQPLYPNSALASL